MGGEGRPTRKVGRLRAACLLFSLPLLSPLLLPHHTTSLSPFLNAVCSTDAVSTYTQSNVDGAVAGSSRGAGRAQSGLDADAPP